MNYPDIFFTPEYARLFEHTAFGGKLQTFKSSGIEYQYYLRPILNTPYFDITSPYGYAGQNIPWGVDVLDFLDSFHTMCVKENIVSEFARLHPFEENHRYLEPEYLRQSGEVYYIDLTQPFQFDKGCKSAIKKASKSLDVVRAYNPAIFLDLYTETMKHNKAEKEYYFDLHFFEQLNSLGEMFIAWQGVAACIILKYGDYAHYFLAANDRSNYGAANLLLSEAIKWSKEQGCKLFNLGGAKDASHAAFKKSFTKLSKPFYTYRRIHLPEIYDKLSAGIESDYFPKYRSVK